MVLLSAGIASADLQHNLLACKAETDSLKRLTCFDAINVGGVPDSETSAVSGTKSPIVMTKANLRLQGKNFQKQVFNDRVEVVPTFHNGTKKTVVAIEHTLAITDAFGDKVINGSSKLDIKIPPGKTVESESFYYWDDNPFIPNEPYDRLNGAVNTGVAKAEMVVSKAVFSDGTSENYK
jgi:hypothetical protein